MPVKPTQVLFVDDDPTLLETVQLLMKHYAGDSWDIFTAQEIAQALSILQEREIDLMVVDIHMPLVDGIQFLQLLHRKFPNIQKVVLTGDSTGAYRNASLDQGAELYLEKPREENGWQTVYATLKELVKLRPEEQGFRGVLRKVGLQDVLQLECLAANSSVLELIAGKERGEIYIQRGKIVHAQSGELKGVDAFFHLYTLAGGEFVLKPYTEPPQIDIVGYSWEGLLMEAAQLRDESPRPTPESLSKTILDFCIDDIPSVIPRVAVADVKACLTAEEAAALRPQVDEMLVSSLQGDVLYEWKCANTHARISFLEFLIQKSGQMAKALPLGEFDRLEAMSPDSRLVARIQPEHAMFVLTSQVPAIQTASSSPNETDS